jgi:hypothetical protein
MTKIKFRNLRADEIEVRPAHSDKETGKVNLLLYIDSRAVVNLLDETVGCLNWKSRFYEANGLLIGEISIYNEDLKEWICKGDTGSESNIEKEKGLVSDVYKRVLSRWGVTELYSSPKIRVEDDGYGNKGYRVSEIDYNSNREITHLVIINRFGKEVYRMPDNQKTTEVGYIQPVQEKEEKELSNSVVLTGNNLAYQIQESADKLLKSNGTVNTIELNKFVKYYTQRVNEGKWKGNFNFNNLFEQWMERSRKVS